MKEENSSQTEESEQPLEAAAATDECAEDGAAQQSVQESAEKAVQPTEKKHKIVVTKEIVAEYALRVLVLCVGLFIMSIGVGLSIKASLGTSPISSIPTVTHYISGLSVGTTTIIVNAIIVLVQILILRRRFQIFQLLQVAVATVFGLLCDDSLAFLESVEPVQYWAQWLICIAGIVLVAIGVSCEVAANVITLPGEGLSLSMCKVFPKVKFGYMKVICDSSLVIIAVALSLIFLKGLQGVREGTVAAAIFVGLIAKQLNKLTVPAANKLYSLVHRREKAEKADCQTAKSGN